MKLEILREHLDRAAGIAAKVSNKNLSLPVLGCALFVVSNDRAVLRATNLDVSVEVVLKAKVSKDGVVAVPATVLAQTVAAFSDQKLTVELVGTSVVIKGEKGKSSIATIDTSEFPTLPYVKQGEGVSATLPTHEIVSALRMVSFAAAQSSMKPELSSISILLEKGELVAAATDSFRLAEVRIPAKVKASFGPTLIPARNVPDIIRATEGSLNVEVRVSENQCTFVSDAGFVTSRTIDGAFPDYNAIIPKEFVATVTSLKEDVVRAFRKVSIFADTFNQVHIAVKPSEKKFAVQSSNTAVGETDEEVPGALDGQDVEINFNARYITDALSVIGGDSVTFSVAGAGKPMIIEDSPKRGFLYLVMPMNR
ncbi:MAG: DNA polymerase III subunit beta [Patescibacteria group bacterium]